jgi:hypothetical protein
MGYVEKLTPQDKPFEWMLPECATALQPYTGPLLPKDFDAKKGSPELRKALLDWWAANHDKTPTQWKLASLTARGYKLADPADAETAVRECLRALRSEDGMERYTAAGLLTAILPDGESIVYDVAVIWTTDSPPGAFAEMLEFFRADITRRANHFLLVGQSQCHWAPSACKYVPNDGAK